MTAQNNNPEHMATEIRNLFKDATQSLDEDDERLRQWQMEFCYLLTDIENGSPPIAQQAMADGVMFIDGIKNSLELHEAQ